MDGCSLSPSLSPDLGPLDQQVSTGKVSSRCDLSLGTMRCVAPPLAFNPMAGPARAQAYVHKPGKIIGTGLLSRSGTAPTVLSARRKPSLRESQP
eukprot:scaffold231077_cov30-Tisochrysis_lutea.AAC.5